jgi:hypothetical protein
MDYKGVENFNEILFSNIKNSIIQATSEASLCYPLWIFFPDFVIIIETAVISSINTPRISYFVELVS